MTTHILCFYRLQKKARLNCLAEKSLLRSFWYRLFASYLSPRMVQPADRPMLLGRSVVA